MLEAGMCALPVEWRKDDVFHRNRLSATPRCYAFFALACAAHVPRAWPRSFSCVGAPIRRGTPQTDKHGPALEFTTVVPREDLARSAPYNGTTLAALASCLWPLRLDRSSLDLFFLCVLFSVAAVLFFLSGWTGVREGHRGGAGEALEGVPQDGPEENTKQLPPMIREPQSCSLSSLDEGISPLRVSGDRVTSTAEVDFGFRARGCARENIRKSTRGGEREGKTLGNRHIAVPHAVLPREERRSLNA